MFYLVNTKLHSTHTVRAGSKTEFKLKGSGVKSIRIGHDLYRVFESTTEASTFVALLMLGGGQE